MFDSASLVAVNIAQLLYSDSLCAQLNVCCEYEQGREVVSKCHSGIGATRFTVSLASGEAGFLYLIISGFITLRVAVQSNNQWRDWLYRCRMR